MSLSLFPSSLTCTIHNQDQQLAHTHTHILVEADNPSVSSSLSLMKCNAMLCNAMTHIKSDQIAADTAFYDLIY